MQIETPTPDNFYDTPAASTGLDQMYKKVTTGKEIDVHTMLMPGNRRISLLPNPKERAVVLSQGSVVMQYGDQKSRFTAPSHFMLPENQPIDIITLEDVVCYGIGHHEQTYTPVELDDSDIEHFFTEGVYARKMLVPAGTKVPSHKHVYDHLSILAQGRVRVAVGPVSKEYVAPAMIEIKKDIVHTISAVEDSVWFCIHATDATDVESLEQSVTLKD